MSSNYDYKGTESSSFPGFKLILAYFDVSLPLLFDNFHFTSEFDFL